MRTLTFYQMEHSQPKKTGTSSFLCHPTEDNDNKSTLYLKRKSNTIQFVVKQGVVYEKYLNSSSEGDNLVRVDSDVRAFPGHLLHQVLYARNSSGPTYQDDFLQVFEAQLGIIQSFLYRFSTSARSTNL